MNKIISIVILLVCAQTSFADDTKRQGIINGIIEHELGAHAVYEVKESIFKDSIRVLENDSSNIRQALVAFDALTNEFVYNASHLIALFPEGTKDITPELLNSKDLPKYEILTKNMRQNLKEYRVLIDMVQDYQPYKQRRVDELYVVKNNNGGIDEYRGTYFFDSDDNLERYFWLSSSDKKSVMGMINLARSHNYDFIEKLLNKVGIHFSEKFMTYLVSDEDNNYPHDEVAKLQAERKAQIKRQQIKESRKQARSTAQSTNKKVTSQSSSRSSSQRQSTTNSYKASSKSHYVYNEHNTYVVKKNICGATYTKEAMKKFTKYSINDNTIGIKYMLASGELVMLKEKQKVVMVEHGFSLSRVMLSNGRVVWTDTENIKKLQ